MVDLGQLLHGQKLVQKRRENGPDGQTDRQTDRCTHSLLHIKFFGHVEVVASGLTFLQPIIKNVHTDTVIALQALLRRLVIIQSSRNLTQTFL